MNLKPSEGKKPHRILKKHLNMPSLKKTGFGNLVFRKKSQILLPKQFPSLQINTSHFELGNKQQGMARNLPPLVSVLRTSLGKHCFKAALSIRLVRGKIQKREWACPCFQKRRARIFPYIRELYSGSIRDVIGVVDEKRMGCIGKQGSKIPRGMFQLIGKIG